MSSTSRTGQTNPLISGLAVRMPELETTSVSNLIWLCAVPGGQRPTRRGIGPGAPHRLLRPTPFPLADDGRVAEQLAWRNVIFSGPLRPVSNGCPKVVPAPPDWFTAPIRATASMRARTYSAANSPDDHQVEGQDLGGSDVPYRTAAAPSPRLDLGTAHRVRVRWIGVAGLVVVVALVILFARALMQPTQVKVVNQSAPSPVAASAAPRPVLSDGCRLALATATRMAGHADGVETGLRAQKQLMDDYKSGKIDRAAAIPQGSPWRQALARTLQQGATAADQYDADKAAYRKQAAQCRKGG